MQIIKPRLASAGTLFLLTFLFLASAAMTSKASAEPTMTEPAPNTVVPGPAQTFKWTAGETAVEKWWLYAGTEKGARDIGNSGDLRTATEYALSGIPVDGTPIHIRLWYYVGTRWYFKDSVFETQVRNDVTAPNIVSPVEGSVLPGESVDFAWRHNNTAVRYWWIYIGSRRGADDLYNSGSALQSSTNLDEVKLPTDGRTVHVRLWYRTAADGWQFVDTTYQASDDPAAEIEANIALISGNATRNTQFDDNPFRDVPSANIAVADLTINADIYNEALLDTTNSGYFRVKCEVSHFAYDDPIVYPNQPGRAHLHMFFGNTEANAYSTYDSLMNTGTGTCNGEDLNRTAYWVPALLDSQGNALIPEQVMVYYKNDNFRLNGANELVGSFPDNLRMISGNGAATSPQTEYTGDWQAQPVISFSCGPAYRSNDRRQPLIPDCYGSENMLEMQIAFPQCVNEAAGTYLADQSHMSYSENGYYGVRCPDSHPTDISSIMYRIFFSTAAYGGALTNLHLSSDVKVDRILPGGTTLHADWFGAWHRDAMKLWVDNCNNTQADCETGLLRRDPALSLVLRKRGFYPIGYKAPAEELIKLCPGKVFDPQDPLRSVAYCRMQ